MSNPYDEKLIVEEATTVIHYVDPTLQLNAASIEVLRSIRRQIESCDPSKLQWSLPYELIVKTKWRSTRDWNEGKTQLFVAERTTLPVPKVFAIISTGPDRNNDYKIQIAMEKAPGEELEVLWDRSDKEQRQLLRDQVGEELKGYLEQLNRIKHDDGNSYIRSVDGGHLRARKFTPALDRGPFSTEDDFNKGLHALFLIALGAKPKTMHLVPANLEHMLSPHKHPIVFVHGDLHLSNIMVENGHISSIIDWERGGWYPSYWEYISVLHKTKPDPEYASFREYTTPRPHPDVCKALRLLSEWMVIWA